MAIDMVDIVNPETGQGARVVRSAFDKVWSSQGFVDAATLQEQAEPEADPADEKPPQEQAALTSQAPGKASVGETGAGDSKVKQTS